MVSYCINLKYIVFFIIYMILSRFGEREPNINTSILCTLLRGVRGGLRMCILGQSQNQVFKSMKEEYIISNCIQNEKFGPPSPTTNQKYSFTIWSTNSVKFPVYKKKVLHSCPHSRIFPALSLKFANFSMLITRIHQFFRFIAFLPIFPGL